MMVMSVMVVMMPVGVFLLGVTLGIVTMLSRLLQLDGHMENTVFF